MVPMGRSHYAVYLWTFVIALSSWPYLVNACSFPGSTVMAREDPPWYSHVMNDGSREVEYYIRRSVMEIHFSNSNRYHTRWKCVMALQDKLLLKWQDHHANNYYKCAKFHIRSPSILQIAWSNESKVFDIGHCDDDLLHLDPWPIVKYETLEKDYSKCPFSGGYDLKVTDSQTGENGCNLMHRPMRMEIECIGGEGVMFDFLSSNCLPDIKMHFKQQTMCMAGWQHNGYHYSILRKNSDTRNLWCLAMPIHRGTQVKGYLYSDLVCQGDTKEAEKLQSQSRKFLILNLNQRNFPTLCEDEYSQCSSTQCNDYFKQECKKSCDSCEGTSHVKSCMFPKRFKGPWFLKSPNDYWHVEMKEQEMSIQGVGRFQCAAFPDSPSRKSRIYSTVSVYDNGCRPRYTCLKLQRLAPSVISYSLSQSYVWPAINENFGQTICQSDRFQADQVPIEDLYRSYPGSGKPLITRNPEPIGVKCNMSSVHTISATLPEGFVCSGTMSTHCEDPTKMRLNFASCSGLITTTTDYRCLANYEGHYWERILLVQNVLDEADVICFVYNQFKPNEAYVMVAGECDKKAYNFARAGVRKPLLSLRFREEPEPCKSVPITTTLPTTDRVLQPFASSSHSNRTHADQGRNPASVVVTISPSEKSNHQKAGETGKAYSQPKTDYGIGETGDSGDDVTAWRANHRLVFILGCISFIYYIIIS